MSLHLSGTEKRLTQIFSGFRQYAKAALLLGRVQGLCQKAYTSFRPAARDGQSPDSTSSWTAENESFSEVLKLINTDLCRFEDTWETCDPGEPGIPEARRISEIFSESHGIPMQSLMSKQFER